MSNIQRDVLSPDTERRLHQIVQSAEAVVARRALLILRWHQAVPVSAITKEVGMSASGVNHWLKLYRENGMSIFDATDLSSEAQEAPPVTPEPEPIIEAVAEPEKPRRGRKPKAAEAPIPEPVIERVVEKTEAPQVRRGRQPKAAQPEVTPIPAKRPEIAQSPRLPRSSQASEPPTPEAVVETVAPKARRGRQPKAAQPELEREPERTVESHPPDREPASVRQEVAEEIAQPEISLPEPPEAQQIEVAPPQTKALEAFESPDVALVAVITPQKAPEPLRETIPPPNITSVTQLVNYYGIRLNHAQHVNDLALTLFDATAEIHRLPDNTRRLLEAGALLHNVAYEIDPADHHTRGRDMILSTPLRDFSLDERRMIALLTLFHRKKVHPEREPVYLQLAPELRSDTLALAAILRIADGLDNSQSQTTILADVQTRPGELLIVLRGENAEADATRAAEKADLWERLFSQHVRIRLATESAPALNALRASPVLSMPPALRDQVPDLVVTLDPAMSGIRAMRQLALHYTDRLDRLAAQVRAGDDRRLAAMAREIERLNGLLSLALAERFEEGLRWLADRTFDALVAFTLHDRASALADDPDDATAQSLADGLGGWAEAAGKGRELLDFARYDHMIGELRRDLVSEPADDNGALISTLVGPVVWTQLTDLRNVMERGESVTDGLIAVRRLQDYLLYFRSLIGPEAVQALDILAPFENYLGAIYLVQALLGVLEQETSAAAEVMRAAQMNMLDELAEGLPMAWGAINSPVFRRALALALATP